MNADLAVERRLLLVEDNPGDADLIREVLVRPGAAPDRIEQVQTLAGALRCLAGGRIDAVLLDLHLPDGTGVELVDALRRQAPDVPIIALTGLDDEELALRCIAAGAQDHLAKQEIREPSLRRAIGYAMARSAVLAERRRADALQERLAAIVEGSRDAIVGCSVDGIINSWNQGAEQIFHYTAEEAVGQPVRSILRGQGDAAAALMERRLFQSREAANADGVEDVVRLRKDGRAITLSVATSVVRNAAGEVSVIAAIFRDVTESRRRDAELRRLLDMQAERDRRMRALTERLQTLREEERTRISREVHDGLGQLLTGLKMDIRWMRRRLAAGAAPEVLAERLVEAEQYVDQTIASVQRIAVELRPSALDSLGLAAAIRDEARRFEARSGVATSVAVQNTAAIEPGVATALFRVLQELMTNVARHANARRLSITLAEEGGAQLLAVEDDGVGIRPEQTGPALSLGLLGMAERCAAIGGSLELQRGPMGGTLATVRVPSAAPQGR